MTALLRYLAQVPGAHLTDDPALVDPEVPLRALGLESQNAEQRRLADERVRLVTIARPPVAVGAFTAGSPEPVRHDRPSLCPVLFPGLLRFGKVPDGQP